MYQWNHSSESLPLKTNTCKERQEDLRNLRMSALSKDWSTRMIKIKCSLLIKHRASSKRMISQQETFLDASHLMRVNLIDFNSMVASELHPYPTGGLIDLIQDHIRQISHKRCYAETPMIIVKTPCFSMSDRAFNLSSRQQVYQLGWSRKLHASMMLKTCLVRWTMLCLTHATNASISNSVSHIMHQPVI